MMRSICAFPDYPQTLPAAKQASLLHDLQANKLLSELQELKNQGASRLAIASAEYMLYSHRSRLQKLALREHRAE